MGEGGKKGWGRREKGEEEEREEEERRRGEEKRRGGGREEKRGRKGEEEGLGLGLKKFRAGQCFFVLFFNKPFVVKVVLLTCNEFF